MGWTDSSNYFRFHNMSKEIQYHKSGEISCANFLTPHLTGCIIILNYYSMATVSMQLCMRFQALKIGQNLHNNMKGFLWRQLQILLYSLLPMEALLSNAKNKNVASGFKWVFST